jgi:O-antigen/teichoic acid export membrane protein
VTARAQRLIDAARRAPLPEGTYAIGAGLLVAGLTAYGFQILSFRALNEDQYKALNGLWVLVFVVAPGFFQPLEQEVSRALAHRRALGIGGGPLVRRAAVLGGILASIAIAAGLAGSVPLLDSLFHDEVLLLAGLFVAIAAYYVAHMTRGTLSGNGRFGAYGLMNGSEGVVRLVACIVLVVVGVNTPGPYGLALALPPLAAVTIALRNQRGLLRPGPEAPYSELSTALGFLLVGSLLAQLLSYAAFLGAVVLANPGEEESVGRFIAGLFIARIPILLFQAVQAALLPKLAGLAGAGQHDDFRTGIRKLVVIVVGLGALGTLGGFTLGSFAGGILFGDKFELGNRDLGLLAAGSGGFILALTLAQGLIALRGYAQAMTAWLTGIAGFVVVTALGDDLFLRVELGFVAGCAVAAAMMATFLIARLRREIPADAVEELVGTIGHEPLEI